VSYPTHARGRRSPRRPAPRRLLRRRSGFHRHAGETHRATFARHQLRLTARGPGASTFLDIVADAITGVTLNGGGRRRRRLDPERGIGWLTSPTTHRRGRGRTWRTRTRREGIHRFVDPLDGETYLYSQFETADAKRVYACFDQPDLKASFTFHATWPGAWRSRRTSQRRPVSMTTTRRQDGALRSDPGSSPYSAPWWAGHTTSCATTTTASTWGCTAARVCRALRPGRDLRDNQQGFDWYHATSGPVLPRQVRPALRPGVQRRSDGERRLRDVPRGLRVPGQGHRRPARAAGRDDPARDGPHVVPAIW